MPDRSTFWSPVPDWERAAIRAEGLSVTAAPAAAMSLVSGDLGQFQDRHKDLPCIGPRDICATPSYALRLAVDRMLVVRDVGAAAEAVGWSDDGFAISDVSDGFILFDVIGAKARELMALGAMHDFDAPASPAESASMLFAGLKTVILRTQNGWRLHVERPYATAMWQWLQLATREWAPAQLERNKAAS